jgi:hypothetical protein
MIPQIAINLYAQYESSSIVQIIYKNIKSYKKVDMQKE